MSLDDDANLRLARALIKAKNSPPNEARYLIDSYINIIRQLEDENIKLRVENELLRNKPKQNSGRPPKLSDDMRKKLPQLVVAVKKENGFTKDIDALKKILEPMGKGLSEWRAKSKIEKEAKKLAIILSKEKSRQILEK